ncbi:hypothetical protein LINPERHAP2_LOCUS29605, partial [Linum perenne]
EEIGGRRSILWFLQLTSFFNVIITWIRCRRLPALIGNCCRRCRRKQRTEWVVTGKCGRVSHEGISFGEPPLSFAYNFESNEHLGNLH